MRVLVRGAGVAGLATALELARRGAEVTVAEIAERIGAGASWLAGGMLAPFCERESAEEPVERLGREAVPWWREALPGIVIVHETGTLVVAPARDGAELDRFAARTTGHARLAGKEIATLEPALAGRFRSGLFFAEEAHLDPRAAMEALHHTLAGMGVRFIFAASPGDVDGDRFDVRIDCTGIARAGSESELRGVRGEMVYLRTGDISLTRTVRLLHPRIPVYVVPRGEGLFMVGATMIESDAAGPITARSMMELLNAAYALHPAFGEAQIVETGTGVRPAYPDNLPRVFRDGDEIVVNGLYRHGFLLAPAVAREAAALVLDPKTQLETAHEGDRERSFA